MRRLLAEAARHFNVTIKQWQSDSTCVRAHWHNTIMAGNSAQLHTTLGACNTLADLVNDTKTLATRGNRGEQSARDCVVSKVNVRRIVLHAKASGMMNAKRAAR